MRHGANGPQGTLLGQGKRSDPCPLADGHKVKGADVVQPDHWAWQQCLPAPGCRSVRRRAWRPTDGQVLLVLIDQLGETPFELISMSLAIQVTRLLQAWNPRPWIEQRCRILKHR
jgi:hypothetical protein